MVALAALLLTGACGPGEPSRWNVHPEVRRPQPGIIIFLVDGLPPRYVEQGCREGWLPNIERYFNARGTHVRYAATCVPSITYGAITTLITGTDPAAHGILGNRWFDPEKAWFRDYALIKTYTAVNDDFDEPTIYERIMPAPSAIVQTAHRRGATQIIANWAVSGALWFLRDYTAVDKLTVSSMHRVTGWANRHHEWPTLVTLYFPGLDTIGHIHGPSSERFRAALEHADFQIGRACDWLGRQSLLDNMYLVLISDHGLANVHPDGHIDLTRHVRRNWDRNATSRMVQDGTLASRRRYYDRYDTVVNDQDGRRASLHFRSTTGWDQPPTPAEVEAVLTAPAEEHQLWNIPGVHLVAYLTGPNEAVVINRRGIARIRTAGGETESTYSYKPLTGDPLGYLDDAELAAFIEKGLHTSRAWLNATADREFPDIVPHLVPLLRTRRAGQVVLFCEPGYSFVPERGGHGGVHRDDQLMTLYVSGPGVQPGGVIDTARATDVVPTLLDLLNRPADDPRLTGTSLVKLGLLNREPKPVAP